MKLLPEQQAIRDKCFHPLEKAYGISKGRRRDVHSGAFEKIVSQYPVGYLSRRVFVRSLSKGCSNESME